MRGVGLASGLGVVLHLRSCLVGFGSGLGTEVDAERCLRVFQCVAAFVVGWLRLEGGTLTFGCSISLRGRLNGCGSGFGRFATWFRHLLSFALLVSIPYSSSVGLIQSLLYFSAPLLVSLYIARLKTACKVLVL